MEGKHFIIAAFVFLIVFKATDNGTIVGGSGGFFGVYDDNINS